MADKVKKMLKSYWFDGLLLILLGIWLLLWPNAAPKIICIVTGIVLAVLGVIKTAGFFSNKDKERKNTDLLIGLIELCFGIAILVRIDFFIDFFQIITAILMIYGCILMLVQGYDMREEKNARFKASIVFAVVTLVLAVMMLINPAALVKVISQITGVALIVVGLAIIFVLRKPEKKENKQIEKK